VEKIDLGEITARSWSCRASMNNHMCLRASRYDKWTRRILNSGPAGHESPSTIRRPVKVPQMRYERNKNIVRLDPTSFYHTILLLWKISLKFTNEHLGRGHI
jgi:hypothetical protein